MIGPLLVGALLLIAPILLPPLLELDRTGKRVQTRLAQGVVLAIAVFVIAILLALFKQ